MIESIKTFLFGRNHTAWGRVKSRVDQSDKRIAAKRIGRPGCERRWTIRCSILVRVWQIVLTTKRSGRLSCEKRSTIRCSTLVRVWQIMLVTKISGRLGSSNRCTQQCFENWNDVMETLHLAANLESFSWKRVLLRALTLVRALRAIRRCQWDLFLLLSILKSCVVNWEMPPTLLLEIQ